MSVWNFFDPNGALETTVPAISASQITSGTLAASRGGLGADASAFNGLLKMNGAGVASVAAEATDYLGINSVSVEFIQDLISTFVIAGANTTVTYNDGSNTLTIAVSGLTAAQISDFGEAVDDRAGTLFTAGSNISINYNDGSNTLTIALSSTVDLNTSALRVPVGNTALTATEGYSGWDSTNKRFRVHDSVREISISEVGYAPYAYQMGFAAVEGLATSAAMAASGGTYLIPIMLVGHMLLESVSVLNKDTSGVRTWNWDLYVDRLNNSNSIDRVAAGNASNDSFTASVASVRALAAASPGIYLAPGYYWLAVQNRHASNTFAVGADVVGGLVGNHMRFKTTTNPNGSTLDIIAATWTNTSSIFGARLNGRGANSAAAIL